MIMKEKIQMTKLAPHCGCAAKVGPGTLAGVLGGLPKFCDPDLLVGTDTSDDAAVYRVSDDLALIQTLDFFSPVADDTYDFVQIAAANALSDVYAMGGTPKTALNIVAFPKDMEEAAMVDGCNSLQSLIKILVPVVKPSMVTVGLLAFLEAWNNFMIPLYLSSSSNATLPLALVNMRQQTMGVIDYGATEAGVVILMIPAAILFLALQKYYVKGFMAGAVKG